MTRPFRVTFYSFKGGVGRTLALLQVAKRIAQGGRRVVVIDLDLEAPGLGFSAATNSGTDSENAAHRGASDIVFDLLDDQPIDLDLCSYLLKPETLGDRLRVVPAGSQSLALSQQISSLYKDMASPSSTVFQRMVLSLEEKYDPDFVLIDSRTGLSDSAGVCTVELPHLVVAVCGLNDQNRIGMRNALERIRTHPSRHPEAATLLVLSPIPSARALAGAEDALRTTGDGRGDGQHHFTISDQDLVLVERRINVAQTELLTPIQKDHDQRELNRFYPNITDDLLFHLLQHDPWIPILDEGEFRDPLLEQQYQRLSTTIVVFANLARYVDMAGAFNVSFSMAGSLQVHRAMDDEHD